MWVMACNLKKNKKTLVTCLSSGTQYITEGQTSCCSLVVLQVCKAYNYELYELACYDSQRLCPPSGANDSLGG